MIIKILSLIIFALSIKSNNGEFLGEVNYTGGTELVTSSFSLYTQNGELLYSLYKPSAITFFISNSGIVFATNEKEIFHYDLSGNIKKIKDLEYPNGFGFSPDNTLFFASDRKGIYAFSITGESIHQYNPGRLFVSTDRGEKFCVVSNDTLFFYENTELKFIKTLPTPYIHSINFTENDNGITVKMPHGTEIIDITTPEEEK